MVILTMPDVPEAVVVGYSEADALRRAPAILDSILQGYVAEGRRLPRVTRAWRGLRVPVLRRSLVA
jgi:predicted RNase H-like HicB family nuclease